MDKKEFRDYVIEHKRIGLDNSQIARKLGMDAGVFEDACKLAFEEESESMAPKAPEKKAVEAVAQKPRKEKVPGIYYVPQNDDEKPVEAPATKSEKEKIEKAEPAEK